MAEQRSHASSNQPRPSFLPASPQGANPIGWVTTSKGGAAHVHSGNELAVWEWEGRRGGGEIGWAGLDSALPKVIKANDSPGRLS